ncbi:MAG: hypothetical protein JJT82_10045 [Legionellaceae bacterium]|nr:hypothetical protein [Legionellaceae bacterium]
MYRSLAILGFTLLVSACGFHLRGIVNLPPWFNQVAVIADHSTDQALEKSLAMRLSGYQIKVVTEASEAIYWLIIEDELHKEQITAVSSTTIPRQYQLIYKVRYKLVKAKSGKILIPSSLVSTTRQLTINNNQILGSDNEEILLKDEMRDEAVMQIISQLSLHLTRISA